MKKNIRKVVYFKSELPSFSWQSGLYFIHREIDDEIHLAKINPDGKPDRYDDGTFNIFITGSGNRGIISTNMTIEI